MSGLRASSSLVVAWLLVACAPWRSDSRMWAPVEDEVEAWVEDHAVAIGGPSGELDVSPVCDTLAAAPVLGLGESSHGVHELKAAQVAIIKCIAERPGPASVLFELSYEFGMEMDAYVQGADPRPDLGGGDIVSTRDLREMLDWLRGHNQRVAPEDRVRDAVGPVLPGRDPSWRDRRTVGSARWAPSWGDRFATLWLVADKPQQA